TTMPDVIRQTVDRSSCVDEAVERFLDEVHDWARAAIEHTGPNYTSDSHDGGTFMTPWLVLMQAREVPDVFDFFKAYRDAAKAHFEQAGHWHHGYWKQQEAHHGTEHFDIYLHTLWQLQPDDDATHRQMIDAAEHILNRVPEVPAWYEVETDRFISFYLGTEQVGKPGPQRPDHLRFTSMALHVHDMTGGMDYLEHAARYVADWADAIQQGPALPRGLDADGGIYDSSNDDESDFRSACGAAPTDLSANDKRAENLLASGACDTLLRLYQKTGVVQFDLAARRILDVAAPALADAAAWQVQGGIGRYRDATGSTRWDDDIARVPDRSIRPVDTLVMHPEVDHPRENFRVGRRHDMPVYKDDHGDEAPSPLLQMLVGRVTDNDDLKRHALDVGRTMLAMARRAYGDVNQHGCTSRAAHSIARGHGRRNGCGVVTEVLGSIIRDRLKARHEEDSPLSS
ncbi:MAG: hypothetical protein ACOCXX_04485, partial [Planctomycetota bacterium]